MHGVLGWWYSGFFPKYGEPTQRKVTSRVLRFDVVRFDSKATEEPALRQPAAIGRDGPATVKRDSADPPSIQPRNATLAPVELNPNVVNKFLSIDEVDTPAMPVGDWVIDFSELPPGHTSSLVIEMWISAEGKLEHWELIGDLADRDVAERSLKHLTNTPINPALLNGQTVSSFRRIEIMIDIDQ